MRVLDGVWIHCKKTIQWVQINSKLQQSEGQTHRSAKWQSRGLGFLKIIRSSAHRHLPPRQTECIPRRWKTPGALGYSLISTVVDILSCLRFSWTSRVHGTGLWSHLLRHSLTTRWRASANLLALLRVHARFYAWTIETRFYPRADSVSCSGTSHRCFELRTVIRHTRWGRSRARHCKKSSASETRHANNRCVYWPDFLTVCTATGTGRWTWAAALQLCSFTATWGQAGLCCVLSALWFQFKGLTNGN